MTSLSKLDDAVKASPTVSRTQRRGSTLSVFKEDRPREYKVRLEDGKFDIREIDTMGGGTIGGVEFDAEDLNSAASYITSV